VAGVLVGEPDALARLDERDARRSTVRLIAELIASGKVADAVR
jgi:hypothetical protein